MMANMIQKLGFLALAALSLFPKTSTILAQEEDREGQCNPDPHFRTWDDIYYDYHGSCNLYLVRNGLLDIQIHTQETTGYSFVDNAYVDLHGASTPASLQIDVTGGSLEISIDGMVAATATFPLSFPILTPPYLMVGSAVLQEISWGFELTLPNGQYVRFYVYGNSLSIHISGNDDFVGSTGMLGAWDTPGDLYKRDGNAATDPLELAQDWRVGADAADSLYLPADTGTCSAGNQGGWPGCVCGENCPCEGEPQRRELQGDEPGQCVACVDERQIEEACANIQDEGARENCEFDVKTTGDVDLWPNAPFYANSVPGALSDPRCAANSSCEDQGGTCVWGGCTENDKFVCVPNLCAGADPSVADDACVCRLPCQNQVGGCGGDPHFQRWGKARDSFHGECDLVLLHSDKFHDHAGFDMHVRTTIDSYYSYMEAAVVRVGGYILEMEQGQFFLNSERHSFDELPMTFGGDFQYKIAQVEDAATSKKTLIRVDLHEDSFVDFKFYKHFLTVNLSGHPSDFGDSIGLMGDFFTGEMYGRDGRPMTSFEEYGFEWQVNPADPQLFRHARTPQLPFERCRMPSAGRPSRRMLRQDTKLLEEAQSACSAHQAGDFELCVGDVMSTGDIGLASLW